MPAPGIVGALPGCRGLAGAADSFGTGAESSVDAIARQLNLARLAKPGRNLARSNGCKTGSILYKIISNIADYSG